LIKRGRYLIIYAIIAVVGLLCTRLPSAFLPQEDQGNLL
jgi:multidrug efflux pump